MRVCQVIDCATKHYANGYCPMHNKRVKRYGSPHIVQFRAGQDRIANPLYSTYRGMLQRCNDQNSLAYKNYGGRGVTVCDRWLGVDGFSNFIEDMPTKPSREYTLDRIDNDKGYSPENCKWSTRIDQVNNRRLFHNNTSGYRGVSWSKHHERWVAYITHNNKRSALGYFVDKSLAVTARLQAENSLQHTK